MFTAFFQQLLSRPITSHKYDFGHVLIIGGAVGMEGAALLSAKAALRSGAGLVTIASEAAVTAKIAGLVPELMMLAFSTTTQLAAFIQDRKVRVVVVGPGLKADAMTRAIVAWLCQQLTLSLVIDGGALSSLQDHTQILEQAQAKTVVLTPHAGEFQRLTGQPLAAERAATKPDLQAFARQHQCHLVFKGQPTYIVSKTGNIHENNSGNPGLATAGSGDVLAGIVGAFLAQANEDIATAIAAAVYLHGLAGDIAAKQNTQPAMIASDVISAIPSAFSNITEQLS